MDTEERPPLTVVYSATALKELDDIWAWNEQRYSADHADGYVEFLERHIDALGSDYARAKMVQSRHDLCYILIRRKSRGHGHIAVFSVDKTAVNVPHVFHSAQDWQNKLSGESER